jgi:uncharacterized membrane protein
VIRFGAAWLVTMFSISSAAAQSSGGSFGSSDFGGGSGGGGGGGGSSYGSGSSSGGGSSEPVSAVTFSIPDPSRGELVRPQAFVTASDAERDARDDTSTIVLLGSSAGVFVALSIAFVWLNYRFGRDRYAPPTGPFEIRQVTVAFDWRERAAIQSALADMARDLGAGEIGRRTSSEQAVALLRGACATARYAWFQTFRLSQAEAQRRHAALAQELRARFKHELAGARAQGDAPTIGARAIEGEGLVVVSLVVGWRGHMRELPRSLDAATAAEAFASLRPQPGTDVVALEVVWSPAAENDRMSSAELEALYPELVRLDADPRIGRLQCRHCQAIFPAEIGRCPGCGAPPPSG